MSYLLSTHFRPIGHRATHTLCHGQRYLGGGYRGSTGCRLIRRETGSLRNNTTETDMDTQNEAIFQRRYMFSQNPSFLVSSWILGRYTPSNTNCLHLKMDSWKTFSFPVGAKGLFSGRWLLVPGSVHHWKLRAGTPKNGGGWKMIFRKLKTTPTENRESWTYW